MVVAELYTALHDRHVDIKEKGDSDMQPLSFDLNHDDIAITLRGIHQHGKKVQLVSLSSADAFQLWKSRVCMAEESEDETEETIDLVSDEIKLGMRDLGTYIKMQCLRALGNLMHSRRSRVH